MPSVITHTGKTVAEINERFETFESLVRYMLFENPDDPFRSLVISGPPGIGKSYLVNQIVENTVIERRIFTLKGKTTPFQLYELLAAESDSLVIVDDCDNVFTDISALNMLKAVSDPETGYSASWLSRAASTAHFTFTGRMILLTNHLLHTSPHYAAFLDRVYYLNFQLTRHEILTRLRYMAEKIQLPDDAKEAAFSWMTSHLEEISVGLTFRTFMQIARMTTIFQNWETMAMHMFTETKKV